MKKIILNSNICIDGIETIIKKQGWEVIDKKYDFYQSYVSTFDCLNYEAKIDLYIAFKTPSNFIHKIYCYFLELDTDHVFKISEIKSADHLKGQMTTRVADFKYYKTTGNLGFSPYKSPISGQPYNLSHNYHSLFNALIAAEANNELNYVCILLKYDNHARSKKRLRYFVNSYKKFSKSFLFKFEKFEIRKTRALLKAEMLKSQKKKIKLNKNKVKKPKSNSLLIANSLQKIIPIVQKVEKKKTKVKLNKNITNNNENTIESNHHETVIIEGNLKTIFDHKNMTVKIIKKTSNIEEASLESKKQSKKNNEKNKC